MTNLNPTFETLAVANKAAASNTTLPPKAWRPEKDLVSANMAPEMGVPMSTPIDTITKTIPIVVPSVFLVER